MQDGSYLANGLISNSGANGFSDLGLGITGFYLGELIALSAELIFEGVAAGAFFTTGIPLLLEVSLKWLSIDPMFVSTVELPAFTTDDACVFK